MKSKMRKKLIAFMLCMVLVICNSVSILADAPAAATTATEKQVKETGTAKSEGESEEEKSADDEKDTSEQSDEESAPETETTEKKEETTEATTEDKEDATTEATTEAKEETTEATETSDKDQTTGAEDDSDKKDKTSETSEEETGKEKTTEAKDETAPSELTYTNDDVVITVSEVAEGAIPEGAELKVVPILKDDADTQTQYAEVEEKIQEKAAETETEIKGFLAYDITFVDEDGNEIEPNSEVKVSIEYKQAAIPAELSEEDAKNTEVSVMHLEEDADGNVSQVVDMGEAGKVDTLETTDAKQVEKVEVKTESFSVFTITWESDAYNGTFTINVNYGYFDENNEWHEWKSGELDNVAQLPDITLEGHDESNPLDLSKYQIEIDGYSYLETRVDDEKSDNKVKSLFHSSESGYLGTTYYVNYYDINNELHEHWLSSGLFGNTEGNIYFIYEKAGLEIKDNIIENGTLDAVFKGLSEDDLEGVTYVWSRSDKEDGTYTDVEKINYQGGASNLSEDGSALYPSYDEGARKWYKVKAVFPDGSEVVSEPFQVPYFDELQNGSFETPQYNRETMTQISNEEYYNEQGVWQSTGEKIIDGKAKNIEILHVGIPFTDWNDKYWDDGLSSNYAWKTGENPYAKDGFQFAELNCEATGALYQDVLTIPGSTLHYRFSHRARGTDRDQTEYDTMFLVITSTSESQDLTQQNQLEDFIVRKIGEENRNILNTYYSQPGEEILYNENGTLIMRVTSSDQTWNTVNEIEEYRPTSSMTRFFFMAGKTAASYKGDPKGLTIGNFLDDVWFSQELPDVSKDEFTLQIKKEFAGTLDNTALSEAQGKIKFKISVKDTSVNPAEELREYEIKNLLGIESTIINGSAITPDLDGNLNIAIPNRQIEEGKSYQITVQEIDANLDGYAMSSKVQTSIKQGENDPSTTEPVEGDKAIVNISGETMAYITFTNTYDRSEKKNVTFNKVWDDKGNAYGTRPSSLGVALKATILVTENGETVEKDITGQLGINEDDLTRTLPEEGEWKTTWENVPVYYDYTYANGETVKTKIHYSMVEGEEGEINSVYEYKAGALLPGTGGLDDYTMQNADKDIVGPSNPTTTTRKALKAAAANSVASSANVLSAGGETKTEELGTPKHNKYIEYNENTGEYTLNLDVTGAKGEASGVDVLFVIDTSGSMDGEWTWGGWNPGLLEEVQDLLTEGDNSIIDQIFEGDGNVNSVAYVSFAGRYQTKTSGWYQSGTKESLKSSINRLEATGGTNWTYAMQRAESVLSQRANSGNEKVVIFLSDGEPTYSINARGNEYGHGNRSDEDYYSEAIAEVKDSTYLNEAQIYSVYLNNETKEGMKKFADGTGAELKDGNDLSAALTDILNTIIPEYTNVVITDTLSQYVDFACTRNEVVVTRKTANGRTTTLQEERDYAIVQFGDKIIQVELLNGNALDDGATYTVSFKVKPNETANSYYAENNGYPNDVIGGAGTGATSAGKPGFYSNDSATVTYKINGSEEDKSAEYPMPVVQVTTHNLTFQKVWEQPDDVQTPVNQVTFDVTFTDGTTDEITVSATDDWTYTLRNVPISKKILQVTETTELNDYTSSSQVSSDGLSATVTNTYSKLTTQSIKVQKRWQNDDEAERPESIQVVLYQSTDDGNAHVYEKNGTVTLTKDTGWTYTWTDLPQTEGQGAGFVKYSYAVREVNTPIGYSSSISYTGDENAVTATITNTYDTNCKDEEYYIANVLQTENLTVNKTWEDDGNTEYRPEQLSTTVNVTAGNKTDSYNVDLTGTGGWQKTITVPKLAGNRTYSAEEYLGEGSKYTQQGDESIEQTVNGCEISFVNELNWDTVYTSFVVKKVWNDDNAADRPGSVNFKLQRRLKDSSDDTAWEEYGDSNGYNLSKDNTIHETVDGNKVITSWAMKFTNLPAGYEYRVYEETISSSNQYHYTITSGTTQDTDGKQIATNVITNTLNWSLKKTNSPEGDETAAVLQGATFELKKGDTLIARGTSGENGVVDWISETDNSTGEKYNLQNLNGTYTLTETKAPSGYQLLKSASWTLTFDENGMLTGATGSEAAFNSYISKANGTAADGIVVTLKNDLLYELPETGGPGVHWYTLGGTLLMAGAALIVYRQKRKREVLLRK